MSGQQMSSDVQIRGISSGPPTPSQGKPSTFKTAATLSPTGNLFISSLFANAEINASDLCCCVKKTSDFPSSPTLVQWISSIYGTKLQATIFHYITADEGHEIHVNGHPGDNNLAEGHCSSPFPWEATTGLGQGYQVAGSSHRPHVQPCEYGSG